MFKEWFSGELLDVYVRSRHKDRIDYVGSCLLRHRYLPVVVRQQLHEWVRFVRYFEQRALAVPTSIYDSQVERYLRKRFPAGSASRRRCIRAAVRIFIDMDGGGRFCRRLRAPQPPTNALYAKRFPAIWSFYATTEVFRRRQSGNGPSNSPSSRATWNAAELRLGRNSRLSPCERSLLRSCPGGSRRRGCPMPVPCGHSVAGPICKDSSSGTFPRPCPACGNTDSPEFPRS